MLRPLAFQDRSVQFLVRLSPLRGAKSTTGPANTDSYKVDEASPAEAHTASSSSAHLQPQRLTCWRVPAHLQEVPWPELCTAYKAELTDHLVLPVGSRICEGGARVLPLLECCFIVVLPLGRCLCSILVLGCCLWDAACGVLPLLECCLCWSAAFGVLPLLNCAFGVLAGVLPLLAC